MSGVGKLIQNLFNLGWIQLLCRIMQGLYIGGKDLLDDFHRGIFGRNMGSIVQLPVFGKLCSQCKLQMGIVLKAQGFAAANNGRFRSLGVVCQLAGG